MPKYSIPLSLSEHVSNCFAAMKGGTGSKVPMMRRPDLVRHGWGRGGGQSDWREACDGQWGTT